MTANAEPTRAPLLGEPLPVELMNTIWADRAGVHDALSTDAETLAWLRAVSPRLEAVAPALAAWLVGNPSADLAHVAVQLRRLRDALRRLTADATRDPRPAAASVITDRDSAVDVLNQVAAASPPWPALEWRVAADPRRTLQLGRSAGTGVASMLAAEFVTMLASGTAPQMRACLAPGCVLYFAKDRNRREWCSSACGNRARAARHYQRHRTAGT